MIDNSRLSRLAAVVGRPRLLDFFRRRSYEEIIFDESLPQYIYPRSIGSSARCVPAFEQYHLRRDERTALSEQFPVLGLCDRMPLVRDAPDGNLSQRPSTGNCSLR